MPSSESRRDPYTGDRVYVVGSRQARPNLPSKGCPFCPGGLEAPDPYDVRWFANRWPAMEGDRCEVVLYTPTHDATFWSLGVAGARRVIDLWAARTAELGARDDVDYVLVFENRGPEVGATIPHPHGQIYAYDHVPTRPRRIFDAGWRPEPDVSRRVDEVGGWRAWVPFAPVFPVAVTLAPTERVPDLVSLSGAGRDELAELLVRVLETLDRMWDRELPYMLWVNQRPTGGGEWPDGWLSIEIVSPWRAPGVPRFIAAAEVGGGEFFNPVIPEVLAEQLRAARKGSSASH